MRKQKPKHSRQKQRRDNPTRFDIYAAALYWTVRLILLFRDRFTN